MTTAIESSKGYQHAKTTEIFTDQLNVVAEWEWEAPIPGDLYNEDHPEVFQLLHVWLQNCEQTKQVDILPVLSEEECASILNQVKEQLETI